MAAENGDTGNNSEYLRCPVCQEAYNAPKLLPCLHTFCNDCLENSLKQSGIGSGQAFLCPICRHRCIVPREGVAALKTNIFAVTLQEFCDRKLLTDDQKCDACDNDAPVGRKCIECNDWLCSRCCAMHGKVKVTRDHHLVSSVELHSGKFDELLKENFEPLICGKHGEPLKLFCLQPTCLAPICTVCKTTLGHDGHAAVELDEQAKKEAASIHALMGNMDSSIAAAKIKITNLKREDKQTSQVRKSVNADIDRRVEDIISKLTTQVKAYAEGLHYEVETLAKEHKKDLCKEMDESKHSLQAMTVAKKFAENLLGFGRSEEMVSMSRDVINRLQQFQTPVQTSAPGWRQPRLNPSDNIGHDAIAKLFGTMTFEGEITKSVFVSTFSAKMDDDDRPCALCDVSINDDNIIVVVDRDNRCLKLFDRVGTLKQTIGRNIFHSPNRVTVLRFSQRLVIKDNRSLLLMNADGSHVGTFTDRLQQPVGLGQSANGEVLVADWMSGMIHGFDERGNGLWQFRSDCEAPGYVASIPGGGVVVSDWKQHRVKVFSSDGRMTRQYGGYGSGEGQLDHPYGVCVDAYGHIIVADTWNNRVHLLTGDAILLRLLLTKEDGLQWPTGIAIDNDGNLVIVEQHGEVKIYKYLA